jgi:hypothetical protein
VAEPAFGGGINQNARNTTNMYYRTNQAQRTAHNNNDYSDATNNSLEFNPFAAAQSYMTVNE